MVRRLRSRSHRVIATLVAVIALVGLLVIWAAPRRVMILGVFLDRETTLQATGWANLCGGDLSVAVHETSNEVRVAVWDHKFRTFGLLGGGDCADGFTFTLTAPLGDRVLVDEATGQPVPINPPQYSPPR